MPLETGLDASSTSDLELGAAPRTPLPALPDDSGPSSGLVHFESLMGASQALTDSYIPGRYATNIALWQRFRDRTDTTKLEHPEASIPEAMKPFADSYVGLYTKPEIDYKTKEIERSLRNAELASSSPGLRLGQFALGQADPVALGSMLLGGGATRIAQAVKFGLIGGGVTAIDEALMHQVDPLHRYADSPFSIGAGTVLGAALGGIMKPHSAEFARMRAHLATDLTAGTVRLPIPAGDTAEKIGADLRAALEKHGQRLEAGATEAAAGAQGLDKATVDARVEAAQEHLQAASAEQGPEARAQAVAAEAERLATPESVRKRLTDTYGDKTQEILNHRAEAEIAAQEAAQGQERAAAQAELNAALEERARLEGADGAKGALESFHGEPGRPTAAEAEPPPPHHTEPQVYHPDEQELTDALRRQFAGLQADLRPAEAAGTVGRGEPAKPVPAGEARGAARGARGGGEGGGPLPVHRLGVVRPEHFTGPHADPTAALGPVFSGHLEATTGIAAPSAHHLDIRNPLELTVDALPTFKDATEAAAWRAAQQAKGHDGLSIDATHLGGGTYYVPFKFEQVVKPDLVTRARALLESAAAVKHGYTEMELLKKLGVEPVDHASIDAVSKELGDEARYGADFERDRGIIHRYMPPEAAAASTEKVSAKPSRVQKPVSAAPRVEENIRAQLEATGKFNPKIHATYAAILGDYYHTMATRHGLTADEMFARYPVKIGTALDEAGFHQGPRQKSDAPYTLDLFSQQPLATPGRELPGTYGTRTKLVTDHTVEIGHDRVTNAQQAAEAFAHLGAKTKERFYGLVTDNFGKPLAIIGHSTGTIDGASVHPNIAAFEAFMVPGAAHVWWGHNHPSGNPTLSNADEAISARLSAIFEGSAIEPHGIHAIGAGPEGRWMWKNSPHLGDNGDFGRVGGQGNKVTVPILDREFVEHGRLGPAMTSPAASIGETARLAGDQAGLVLLDNRHNPVAFVPMTNEMMAKLRGAPHQVPLFQALSTANAAAVIFADNGTLTREAIGNLHAMLSATDTRVLDVINTQTQQSWAERGKDIPQARHFFQGQREPVFYSAATRAVEGLTTTVASGEQWLKTLDNLAAKGVKPEELDWLGVREWLRAQPGKVSRTELLEFMREHEIRVGEIERGTGKPGEPNAEDQAELERAHATLAASGFHLEEGAHGEPELHHETRGYIPAGDQFEELTAPVQDAFDHVVYMHNRAAGDWEGAAPKYERYTSEGGEPGTYRELLLQLQPRVASTEALAVRAGVMAKYEAQLHDLEEQGRRGATPELREFARTMRTALMDKMQAEAVAAGGGTPRGASQDEYSSSHWDEGNVLAHVRFNERFDADGRRVLHLEEVQSDWHQEGRRKGYQGEGESYRARLEAWQSKRDDLGQRFEALEKAHEAASDQKFADYVRERGIGIGNVHPTNLRWLIESRLSHHTHAFTSEFMAGRATLDLNGSEITGADLRKVEALHADRAKDTPEMRDLLQQMDAHNELRPREAKGVPDAPFKKSWPELALKRMVRYAAEQGFDRLTWSSGTMQAERYNLARHVDSITWEPQTQLLRAFDAAGTHLFGREVPRAELPATIGEEATRRLLGTAAGPAENGRHRLDNAALDIGGEGMKGFYDEMLPALAAKIGKRYGAKVTSTEIATKPGRAGNALNANETDELRHLRQLWSREVTGGREGITDEHLAEIANLQERAVNLDASPRELARLAEYGERLKWLQPSGVARIRALERRVPLTGADSVRLAYLTELGAEHLTPAEFSERLGLLMREPASKTPPMQETVHALDLSPALKEAAMGGQPLFQFNRGAYNPDTLGISLLPSANKSTFLHETGHHFLNTLGLMAAKVDAPAGIREDMQHLLDWFGIHDVNEWHGMTLDEQRPFHEKFATGFERYLREGVAPSVRLQGMFDQFRQWLTELYKSWKAGFANELTPEVRDVMDRMLASEEEIEAARQARIAKAPTQAGKRLAGDDALRTTLRSMAYDETGWNEVGGHMIRGQRDVSGLEKITRTKWIPNHEWFQSPDREEMNPKAVQNAVDKALAGAKLGPKQQRLIEYMVRVADEREAEHAYLPPQPILVEHGEPASVESAHEAAMVTRARAIDEDGVENLARRHGDDDAAFLRSIKEMLRGYDEDAAIARNFKEEPEPVGQPAHGPATGRPAGSSVEEPRGGGPGKTGQGARPELKLEQPRGTVAAAGGHAPARAGAQPDLFGSAGSAGRAAVDAAGRQRDVSRSSGQESPETGRPDDLFSQARQQNDIVEMLKRLPAEERAPFEARLAALEHPGRPNDPPSPPGIIANPGDSSVGALSHSPREQDLRNYAYARGGRVLGLLTGWFSPGSRALRSPFVTTRTVMTRLGTTREMLEMNVPKPDMPYGAPTPPSVEQAIRQWEGKWVVAYKERDALYRAYLDREPDPKIVEPAKKMSQDEFAEEVGRASRRGDRHAIPEVAASAAKTRAIVFEPPKVEAQTLGLLPQHGDLLQGTAESYLTRMFDRAKIRADRPGWFTLLQESFVKQGAERAEAGDAAHQVTRNILGAELGLTDTNERLFFTPESGRVIPRKLLLPDLELEPYLVNNIDRLTEAYLKSLAPQIEIMKAFPGDDRHLSGVFQQLRDEHALLTQRAFAAGDEATANLLERRYKADARDIKAIRDKLYGIYGTPTDTNGWITRAMRMARSVNVLRLLGSATWSHVPDAANAVLRSGGGNLFAAAAKLGTSLEALRLNRDELQRLGVATDMVHNSSSAQAAEIAVASDYPLQRALQSAARSYLTATGEVPWITLCKMIAGAAGHDDILSSAERLLADPAALSKVERIRLNQAGIGQQDLERIAQQYKVYGRTVGGLRFGMTDKWGDLGAARALDLATAKLAEAATLHPSAGDTPLWTGSEIGKAIFQFKTFGAVATRSSVIPLAQGLAHGDVRAMQALPAFIAAGYLTYWCKQKLAGQPIEQDPKRLALEVLDKSNLLGWVGEYFYPLLWEFGSKSFSRWGDRKSWETLGGPVAGSAVDAFDLQIPAKLIGEAKSRLMGFDPKDAHFSRGDIHRIRRMLPYNQYWPLRRLVNAGEQKVGDWMGLPPQAPQGSTE